jgi:hypothetical protein
MITARPTAEIPQIKGTITPPAQLLGRIVRTFPEIKARIYRDSPEIKGTITKDLEIEPYYEVSNEYGTTIIIGE